MSWFNYYGLIIVVLILVPNIIYSVKKKDEFINSNNKRRKLSLILSSCAINEATRESVCPNEYMSAF